MNSLLKSTLIAAFIALALCQGHIKIDNPPSHIIEPLQMIPEYELPANWNWGDMNGTNYLTIVKNQHIPQYCGSCWAMASTSALSDRIKIMRNAQWPDINLAPQVIISCERPDNGCHGGNGILSYQYMFNYSISDETCSNYQAFGWDDGLDCSDFIKCGNCDPTKGCFLPDSYLIYKVKEYGPINGSEAMMNEIYQRGPIDCSINSNGLDNYTGGIINSTLGNETDHEVSIVGWGTTETNVPYWIVRNSWGSFWGEYGFFRIIRGTNNLGIEGECAWAVPEDTWTKGVRNYTNSSLITKIQENVKIAYTSISNLVQKLDSFLPKYMNLREAFGVRDGCLKNDPKYDQYRVMKEESAPWAHIKTEDLPTNWDWRNVNGVNYLSWNKNQHIPQYCGSCWAQGTTSSLADRIAIASNNTHITIGLSPQAIINCNAGGDCNGGDPLGVYEYAYNHGIPEDSCQNYEAKNPAQELCSPEQVCKNCHYPPPNGTCNAITDFPKWYVSEFGGVFGVDAMKKAIYNNGPIGCGMDVTAKFETYSGGIYSEVKDNIEINHEIAVVGWGQENGVDYWIGRNSWGTYWGEWGFFRMKMGSDNLGIETNCNWGIPIINN